MFDLDAMQEADDRLTELETQVDEARRRLQRTLAETAELRDVNRDLVARSIENRSFVRPGRCPVVHSH